MERPQLPLEDAPAGFADNLRCFVCGPKNPIGLRLAFEYDTSARTSRAEWTPTEDFQGWAGILHGGILAALLDEAMVNLAVMCGLRAVTAEMTFRLSRSARIGVPLLVAGRITGSRGRLVLAEGEVSDREGRVAWAEGKLLRPRA
jgi:acyl-coenzyme A thioesterase PaaI-like protein